MKKLSPRDEIASQCWCDTVAAFNRWQYKPPLWNPIIVIDSIFDDGYLSSIGRLHISWLLLSFDYYNHILSRAIERLLKVVNKLWQWIIWMSSLWKRRSFAKATQQHSSSKISCQQIICPRSSTNIHPQFEPRRIFFSILSIYGSIFLFLWDLISQELYIVPPCKTSISVFYSVNLIDSSWVLRFLLGRTLITTIQKERTWNLSNLQLCLPSKKTSSILDTSNMARGLIFSINNWLLLLFLPFRPNTKNFNQRYSVPPTARWAAGRAAIRSIHFITWGNWSCIVSGNALDFNSRR